MKIIKFTLSGKSAFFKKPEVNTYYYFTYGNIHKLALLGMFGAILGYKGYSACRGKMSKKDMKTVDDYPEFYEKLHHMKLSILPNFEKGFIPKKIQVFNNSVGYASKEQGGNLIVKEQWLENPSWDIAFLVNSKETEQLAEALKNRRCIYTPYLGKNDHLADISNVEELETSPGCMTESLDCLAVKSQVKMVISDDDDDFEELDQFKYEEKLPYKLNIDTNNYEFETFIYTNMPVEIVSGEVYCIQDKHVMFY